MATLYTVKYSTVSEDEFLYPSTTIMSIDFDSKEKAEDFFQTIEQGNEYGEGYKLQLSEHEDSTEKVLREVEF